MDRPVLTKKEREALVKISRSRTEPPRVSMRAKMMLMSSEGVTDRDIGRKLDVAYNTVGIWRKRFITEGMRGLYDRNSTLFPKAEKVKKQAAREERILKILKGNPPRGYNYWSIKAMASVLKFTYSNTRKILVDYGIKLRKPKPPKAPVSARSTKKKGRR
jgi:putative transposase